jgi:acetyl-CoA C-acetyltransferase
MSKEIAIVAAARTPIGAFQGALSSLTAPRLGAEVIKAVLARSGLKAEQIDEVLMGNVLQGGIGQAPARQAAIFAGLPEKTPATTINKVCGSGLKAVLQGAQAILAGDADFVIAGGMESMSNAPYFTHAMRGGARMGNTEMKDLMIHDGLWDPYNNMHMGMCGEKCATDFKFSRQDQDAFSLESTRRAQKAQNEGAFAAEITKVQIPQKKGDPVVVSEDEGPKQAKPDKIPSLKPVFKSDGTITAANASSINDGAAAVLLTTVERAKADGLPILGRLSAWGQAARTPVEFTIAPADAIRKTLQKANLQVSDIDLFEINEAFAVVTMANNQLLGLDPSKVNVRGGAVVLGHPIGASGCRLLVTLLHTMKDMDKKRGLVSLCIGGGEGIAAIVER